MCFWHEQGSRTQIYSVTQANTSSHTVQQDIAIADILLCLFLQCSQTEKNGHTSGPKESSQVACLCMFDIGYSSIGTVLS